MATMKAVVKTKPGPGAELQDVPIPTPPQPDWVVVKVRAAGICGTDVHIHRWDRWADGRIGAKALPQILGHEVAGEVVEVGPHCKRLKVGDYISAETHIYDPRDLTAMLGALHVGTHMKILGVDYDGCFAEYFALPEVICWPNDPAIPPECAAIQEPLGNATYAVLGEDADVAGKSMVIMGDGAIGLFAVAVARAVGVAKIIHFGMTEFNLRLARQLGTDLQMDITGTTPQDRLAFVLDNTGGHGADIALEMVGAPEAITDCFAMVRKAGRVSAFGIAPESTVPLNYNDGIVFKGCQIHGISGRKIFDTWYRNRNLLASGRLDPRPVITHVLPLEEFETGFTRMTELPRACAKIVLFPDKAECEAARKRMGQK